MEWLLAEEVIFFFAALTASGLLLTGTLKRIRPPVRRGRPSTRLLSAPEDRAPSPPQDRAALALRLGRTLLDRALQDSDPTSERRRRLIYRAIACLNRGIEATPLFGSIASFVRTSHAAVSRRASPSRCMRRRPLPSTAHVLGVALESRARCAAGVMGVFEVRWCIVASAEKT